MQRLGIVDLGSNTARLVVYGYEPGRWFRLLDQIREPVRLGQGLAASGNLSSGALERGLAALKLFADYAQAVELTPPEIFATSAIRDATNGLDFLREAEPLGMPIHVLSGEDEARFGVTAVANCFVETEAWVMDLGGGSAQISRMEGRAFRHGQAYPLGAVRLTEAFPGLAEAHSGAVAAVEAAVAAELKPTARRLAERPDPLISMGGSIRNLARVAQKRHGYPLSLLHHYWFSLEALEEVTEVLLELPAEERGNVSGVRPDRGDIILAAALVYRWLLRESGHEGLYISGQGVREGFFLSRFLPAPHRIPGVRAFSIANVASRYPQPSLHLQQVRRLCRRLFTILQPLHGFGEEQAELLDAAALLHDIGTAVAYYRHNRHGAYLLGSEALGGFTSREQALLIQLVRFHNRGQPQLGSYEMVCRPEDGRLFLQLAACLRLAEHLERSRAARVLDLEGEIHEDRVVLQVLAREEPTVELSETRKQAGVFAEAFNRRLELEPVLIS